MKARLITNGILSIVSFVIFIVYIFMLLSSYKISSVLFFFILFYILMLANFVMGVITLSMEKHQEVRGLTIASGIFAILGGMFFVNAIVSFIAVARINETEKHHNDILEEKIGDNN